MTNRLPVFPSGPPSSGSLPRPSFFTLPSPRSPRGGTPELRGAIFTDWHRAVANAKVGGVDPQTPVFTAEAGQPVRFRLLQAGGHSRNIVFALHGHVWDKEPYVLNSTRLGRNDFSFWEGARMGHGPSNHFDVLVRNGAGGAHLITGDYLFRDQVGIGFDNGLWGILRVVN